MIVPFILLLAALAGIVAALALPGMSDLLLLAGPCALASLILLLQGWLRRPAKAPEKPRAARKPSIRSRQPANAAPKWIVIDGSNVMHWKDEVPQIGTVQEVVKHLTGLGYAPGVVFDANAGYKITGSYQHDGALGRLLGLPEERVMVVAKGTPADPTILAAARDLGARVVSNDRYRDWAETYPEVLTPGHVLRGGYRDGKLWLDA
ncbi:NYN domain-containing protein [Rhodobacter ferrooxidans]|uniref:RNase NYN domain-containing protein n=1 Tax=Rhodobacter ferrooxidans TaxID=371731 RepID=C8RYG1_9RHOB|nr:hypothetical protein [Rhodobacter sp. SW2]EEW26149.1 conserved hypothetical protein [Rhodobacter sp. SW2]